MYASNVPVDLVVKYTDVYHQDPSDTMNITFTLNLFSIEPPVFQEQLSPLNANTWADFYITLPNIVDPNGLRWGVSLDQSAQSWVIYNQNNSLTLLTSRLSLNTSEVMNIRIRITNEDNAWTEYNQTVTVDPLISPVFGTINNLTVSANTVTEFDYVFTGSSAVTAVDWQTNATISWVSLNRASNKLIIVFNSNYILSNQQWVRLKSSDSWGNTVYSNNFTISVSNLTSSRITVSNTFGPLIAFVGEKKLFKIPDDLFRSEEDYYLSINIIEWQSISSIECYLEQSETKGNFIYVMSKYPNSWKTSIIASNSNSSAEIMFYILIKTCASKDCIKCSSEYQIDWSEWVDNYVIDKSTGACLRSTQLLSDSLTSFYDIWGIIVMWFLILNVLAAIVFRLRFLYLFQFAQTVILYIHCSPNIDQNLINFTSWFQFVKFDFRFMTIKKLINLFNWTTESDRMASIQFYWQATILNYFNLIVLLIIFILCVYFVNMLAKKFEVLISLNSYIQDKIDSSKIVWMFIHLLLPMFIINLIEDVTNFNRYPLHCLASLMIFTLMLIYLILKKASIFSVAFMAKIDQVSPLKFTLLTIIKSIILSVMFVIESRNIYIYMLWGEILVQFVIVFILLYLNQYSSQINTFTYKTTVIINCWFILILLLILWRNKFSSQDSNSKVETLLIVAFFVYSTCIDLWLYKFESHAELSKDKID